MLCTRIIINAYISCFADAHKGSWCIYAHGVLPTVVLSFSTLINIFTVGIVLSKGSEAISAATDSSVIQVSADRMLHAVVSFGAKVVAFTDFAATVRQGDLLRFWTV